MPELEVFSGFARGGSNGNNGHHPSSLPPVAPPPRRSPQNLNESVTNVRGSGTPDLGPGEALEWSDEEESTQVYADGRSEPPPNDAQHVRAATPPPSSAALAARPADPAYVPRPPPSELGRASGRPPRIVPPAPSRATLLGVAPEAFGQRPPSSPSTHPAAPYSMPAGPYEPVPGFPDPNEAAARALATYPPGAQPSTAGGSAFPPAPSHPPAAPSHPPAAPSHPPAAIDPRLGAPEPRGLPLPPARGPSLEFPPDLAAARAAEMPSIPQAQIPAGAIPTTEVSGDDLYQRYATQRPQRESANRRAPMVSHAAIDPPQESSTGKMAIAIALVTALITAGAAGAFFLLRRPGALEIEVKDPKGASVPQLTVYVDGRKVCDTSPCVVRDLEPGSKSIRVVAAGYADEEPQKADISAGSTNKLAITLKPAFGVLVAASEQPNLRISVDGTERGPLPARLTDLSAGDHQIRVFGGDRYKPLEKNIDVKIGDQIDLGSVKLEVVRGKMTVSVKSEGTSIVLIPNDDEKKAKALDGPFPRAVEVETNSGSWKLVAKKKGFPDFVAPLDFSDGVAEKTLEISMEKPTPPVADLAALEDKDKDKDKDPKPVASNDTSTPTPTHTSDPKPVDTPTAPAPDAPAFLNINSIPVSRILLDGTPMGETPRSHVQVTPGTHTVTFVNAELGKKSVTVTVKAGETKTAAAKLRD